MEISAPIHQNEYLLVIFITSVKNNMYFFRYIFLLLFSFYAYFLNASETSDIEDTLKTVEFISDDPIVAMLDSMANHKFWNSYEYVTDTSALNIYNYQKGDIPEFSDSVYESRIAALNAETPFEMVYNNDVKRWINLYAKGRRDLTSRMLGLSELYFPLFEEQLDKYDLPLELKYLAIVESALNPAARSRAGAKGLWQFMYRTGKLYKLNVTSLVDDRCDPYKSTVAACQHMRDLYDIYNDWSLVLAAYNAGAGNVNKAVRRSGNKLNYWLIQHYLPRETRGYVPAFIAVSYVMNYAAEHNLYPVKPQFFDHEIDTVSVKQALSFKQISEMLSIPTEELEFLNPSYVKGIIPAAKDKSYMLSLRKEYINGFINNETALYNYKTKEGIDREQILAEVKQAQEREIHIVRSGENLGLIARKYNVRVSDLQRWNNMNGTLIRPNQRLVVYAPAGNKPQNKTTAQSPPPEKAPRDIVNSSSQNAGKYFYYTVEKGDTLWDIANKYKGVTVSQIQELNNISNTRQIKPGQKIKVPIVS